MSGFKGSWVIKVAPDTHTELSVVTDVGDPGMTILLALANNFTLVFRCLGPVVDGTGVPVGEERQLGPVWRLGLGEPSRDRVGSC